MKRRKDKAGVGYQLIPLFHEQVIRLMRPDQRIRYAAILIKQMGQICGNSKNKKVRQLSEKVADNILQYYYRLLGSPRRR